MDVFGIILFRMSSLARSRFCMWLLWDNIVYYRSCTVV